ncbi:hypothetical protein [Streptomyces sp. NPDC090445]|uniref:hypothetical protein n=1 Tax=Streptomyces sp. NPDC090445 TaxID=3365963 RepID=UPI0037F71C18
MAAAAAAAYLGQEAPRRIGDSLGRRRARRELEASDPLAIAVRVRHQDYVLLDDSGRITDVPASGHSVQVIVTGSSPSPVVLTELRAEVVSREERHGEVSPHAAEIPVRRFEVLLDADPPSVRPLGASDFPYSVAQDESEVLDLVVTTDSGDVRWVLWLDWTTAGRSGSTRVDLGGQPFRTAARHPRPAN